MSSQCDSCQRYSNRTVGLHSGFFGMEKIAPESSEHFPNNHATFCATASLAKHNSAKIFFSSLGHLSSKKQRKSKQMLEHRREQFQSQTFFYLRHKREKNHFDLKRQNFVLCFKPWRVQWWTMWSEWLPNNQEVKGSFRATNSSLLTRTCYSFLFSVSAVIHFKWE